MVDGPRLALQKALIGHLRATPAIVALVVSRVYDEPPGNVVFPYVRLARMELQPDRTDCATDWRITFAIDVYSRPVAGRVEATRIGDEIIAALDDKQAVIAVSNFDLCWIQFITSAVSRDADGITQIATIAFEASLDV